MKIHLVNASDHAFGTAVIAPRWLFVLAAATPRKFGDPILTDETLEPIDPEIIRSGDIVGISIHTGNALRGYHVGKLARERGATVIYGGIHATLYPEEPFRLGSADAVVTGDGEIEWPKAVEDCVNGRLARLYHGGRLEADRFVPARWDLMPEDKYLWASVQTVRGCPKHCSFCSVWRTDGQQPRSRKHSPVIQEIVDLRRKGFRFIALADDNFYPVTLTDLRLARQQNNTARLQMLEDIRSERFRMMEEMAQLPSDLVFFTQITMESAEDTEYLEAMRKANIKGALVGIEAVTREGLKSVYKDFNCYGDKLAERLATFERYGVHVLGSFIFGLPTDRAETFRTTLEMAMRSTVSIAQFVMLTPLPGTIDFARWEKQQEAHPTLIGGTPITRYWLIPSDQRPNMYTPHPTMSSKEIADRTRWVWDRFYSWPAIWKRSRCTPNLRCRLAFILLSKLYRQMYAGTGLAADSARKKKENLAARWTAKRCRRLFHAKPMPDLMPPAFEIGKAHSIENAA